MRIKKALLLLNLSLIIVIKLPPNYFFGKEVEIVLNILNENIKRLVIISS